MNSANQYIKEQSAAGKEFGIEFKKIKNSNLKEVTEVLKLHSESKMAYFSIECWEPEYQIS